MSGNPHYIPNPTEYYRTWEEEPYYIPQEARHWIKGQAGSFSRRAHAIPGLALGLSAVVPALAAVGGLHQVYRSNERKQAKQAEERQRYAAERAAKEQADVVAMVQQAEQHVELIDKLEEARQEAIKRGGIFAQIQHEDALRLIEQNRAGLEQTSDQMSDFIRRGDASMGLISEMSRAHKEGLAAQVALLKGVQNRLAQASFSLGPATLPTALGKRRPKATTHPWQRRITASEPSSPRVVPAQVIPEVTVPPLNIPVYAPATIHPGDNIGEPPVDAYEVMMAGIDPNEPPVVVPTYDPPAASIGPEYPTEYSLDDILAQLAARTVPEQEIPTTAPPPVIPVYDFGVPDDPYKIGKSRSINTQSKAHTSENRTAKKIWDSIASIGLQETMNTDTWRDHPEVAWKFTPEGAQETVLSPIGYIPPAMINMLSPRVKDAVRRGFTYERRGKYSRGSMKK